MRSPRNIVALLAPLLVAIAAVRRDVVPPAIERDGPARPSRHAAPPDDVAALNAAPQRRVPESLSGRILPDDRPSVVLFLKAECGCSEDFARTFTTLAPHLAPRASCLAVIEASEGDEKPFLEATGLVMPCLIQADSSLAAAWGVTKAGCVALVRPDGTVEAIWPGVSRQGFRDLAGRLGDADLIPGASLSLLPGPATAGCPLRSASLFPPDGVAR